MVAEVDDCIVQSAAPRGVKVGESAMPAWSFVIPCRNEERNLAETLHCITRHTPAGVQYEVIVIDHGSTDATVHVARALGAKVISSPGVTLGRLRNVGAEACRGDSLIFIDADISLTPDWSRNVLRAMKIAHDQERRAIVGSLAQPSPTDSWVATDWETGRNPDGPTRSLGGGHMIISRSLFFSVGGFPDEMDAGEDEGLCVRVRCADGVVLADKSLLVIHRGVPRTLGGFVRRQFWHGLGDAISAGRLLRTRTAILSLSYFLSFTGLIVTVWIPTLRAAAVPLLAAVLALPTVAVIRRGRPVRNLIFPRLWLLYVLYFLSRGIASILGPFGVQGRVRRG